MIPAEVITEDHRLDQLARIATEELARLRWHWTLDETNPERETFDDYAAAVERSVRTIGASANGYASFIAADTPDRGVLALERQQELSDHIRMARHNQTRQKAAQLIADNTGSRPANVLNHKSAQVSDLIRGAEDAARRRGTTVDDELERAAETRRKMADVRAAQAERAKAQKDARYIEIEGDVGAAMRHMKKVLDVARTVALSDEHIELIVDSIGKLKALLNMIDMQLVGTVDIDWDAEMAKIGDIA